MIITKEFTFEAAHRLPLHTGACANVHGHSYRVRITLATVINHGCEDMVMDFGEVKKRIYGPCDHAFISASTDRVGEMLYREGMKVYFLPKKYTQPTAETMAEHFAELVGPQCTLVEVWETANSCAVWSKRHVKKVQDQ
uniref:Putative 6-Pyruvoyl tetrahydrobiopterin synthase n=1 Tax=viral metagenome TaxID=1070528 RepID=A0A6M3KTV2_9ZZZZ